MQRPDSRTIRILISAYACEPRRGSEPGAGWLWALAAAANHDVTVLTRTSRREAFTDEDLRDRLEVKFIDLPRPILRLVGTHERLYYVLWQFVVAQAARRLHRKQRFDVVHHVTFANAWLPALACSVNAPFVLGPVGGGTSIPTELLDQLDWRGRLFEKTRTIARRISSWNPLVRLGWSRAHVIVAQNRETVEALPRKYSGKTTVRPHSVVGSNLERLGSDVRRETGQGRPVALLSGRLTRWKGGTIAVSALSRTTGRWNLNVVGSGPAQSHLRSLVANLGLGDRVQFIPWLPQDELWQAIRCVDAVIVPSLRDDAPLAVAEAQALGVPVIAFDQGGVTVMGRLPGATISLVPYASSDVAANGFAQALDEIAARSRPNVPSNAFGLQTLERYLSDLYGSVVARSKGDNVR